jgi:phosphate uptake regulator
MIFERHAFAGLDADFETLHAMLAKMQERNLQLLSLLQDELKQIEQRYPQAKAFDKEINALEHEVDRVTSGILSKFTLLGTELRFTLSVFKIAYILECIADNLKNAIKRLSKLKSPAPAALADAIRAIADATQWPLAHCLSILVKFDETMFQQLLDQKKAAGTLYRTALLTMQNLPAGSISAEDSAELHLILRNIERCADFIADSAKVSYFIHTGEKYEKPI